jgi:hypothetical protein
MAKLSKPHFLEEEAYEVPREPLKSSSKHDSLLTPPPGTQAEFTEAQSLSLSHARASPGAGHDTCDALKPKSFQFVNAERKAHGIMPPVVGVDG